MVSERLIPLGLDPAGNDLRLPHSAFRSIRQQRQAAVRVSGRRLLLLLLLSVVRIVAVIVVVVLSGGRGGGDVFGREFCGREHGHD